MAKQTRRRGKGIVRIIGGAWRGRKLLVADAPGLRPSGDRSRETLFNWLQAHIEGSNCADLFAGTGALGFEAASRGARSVTLIERSSHVASVLDESLDLLNTDQVEVVHGDALEWLAFCKKGALDIVFVDPPFDSDLAAKTLRALAESDVLTDRALVYLESPKGSAPEVPAGLVEIKHKRLGDVEIRLLQKSPES